jgi:hypothetical protein
MPIITVTRKPASLQAFQLTSQAEMNTALIYLSTRGYSGEVACGKNTDGSVRWAIIIRADSGNTAQQIGNITDWLVVENDSIATIYTNTKATQLFQAA